MNYEEKYKEALERAKQVRKYSSDLAEIKRMEEIFPELRESEDEKMIKDIMDCVESCYTDEYAQLILAWLEKQVDKDKFIEKELGCIRGYREKAIKRLEELEKQGEQQSYGQMEECADCQFNYAGECKGSCTMKKSEPNLTDNAEPKFHEGDWIIWDNKVICYIDSVYQGKETFMYTIVDTNGMIRSYGVKGFEKNARLWTIKDAKDGDVLFVKNFDNIGGCVFLFNGLDSWKFDAEGDRAVATGYCCASITESGNTDFGIQGPDCVEIKRVHPASKDQRDLLFQKMHEAGYMWDSKSKQLLSLKAEPSGKQKPAGWSEEDERNLQGVIDEIEANKNQAPDYDIATYDRFLSWLKSLKERYTWKPSEEQSASS